MAQTVSVARAAVRPALADAGPSAPKSSESESLMTLTPVGIQHWPAKRRVPTAAGINQHPNDPNIAYGPVTGECLSNDVYTGNDVMTPPPGFGGPATGFSHDGGMSGNLENNPHNLLHVYVGGSAPDQQTYGLMSDPGLAALDPVFYVHHANIDRMWATWNANAANKNPAASNWLNGPAAAGERGFVMPMPDGSA